MLSPITCPLKGNVPSVEVTAGPYASFHFPFMVNMAFLLPRKKEKKGRLETNVLLFFIFIKDHWAKQYKNIKITPNLLLN